MNVIADQLRARVDALREEWEEDHPEDDLSD